MKYYFKSTTHTRRIIHAHQTTWQWQTTITLSRTIVYVSGPRARFDLVLLENSTFVTMLKRIIANRMWRKQNKTQKYCEIIVIVAARTHFFFYMKNEIKHIYRSVSVWNTIVILNRAFSYYCYYCYYHCIVFIVVITHRSKLNRLESIVF